MFFSPAPLKGAACTDLTEAEKRWFYAKEQGARVHKALAICAECPARTACLERALEFESVPGEGRYGVWGGLTASERRQIYGAGIPEEPELQAC